jgi:hypothetical protein
VHISAHRYCVHFFEYVHFFLGASGHTPSPPTNRDAERKEEGKLCIHNNQNFLLLFNIT